MKNLSLSKFIAKQVIAIDNGQDIGYILDCCFDSTLTKLLGFVVADEESERENFLPVKNIKIIGEDCVLVESSYKLDLNYVGYTNNPIGKSVFDDKGFYLGRVFEIIFDNFKVEKLITDKCEIFAKQIYSCGIDCLFFGNKKKKKISANRFNRSNDLLLPKVETQNKIVENNSNFKISENNNIIVNPSKVVLAPSSLLNKTATIDIYGFNNELIIKEGQVINQSKIDKAKKHGKLNLLIINSK